MNDTTLAIRPATPGDTRAVIRLAALNSAPAPQGALLPAERHSALVAAVPVTGGRPIVDPCRLTEDAVALLRLRAPQLGA